VSDEDLLISQLYSFFLLSAMLFATCTNSSLYPTGQGDTLDWWPSPKSKSFCGAGSIPAALSLFFRPGGE
jgi:hypothetical protein